MVQRSPDRHPRQSIYYWKCVRPGAFHGTDEAFDREMRQSQLQSVLQNHFGGKAIELRPAGGQGNHITWFATIGGKDTFGHTTTAPSTNTAIFQKVQNRPMHE